MSPFTAVMRLLPPLPGIPLPSPIFARSAIDLFLPPPTIYEAGPLTTIIDSLTMLTTGLL
jgi:hypothetical protein